ncbi:MAG: polysaccharide deacetylase family protein [Bacteroidota bacterium]
MNLVIINFHYFREVQYESGIYPVNFSQFSNQISLLSEKYKFVSQNDICNWIETGDYPEGNYCLITFDDGLKEQMEAFKYLKSLGIPAIFYIPTDPIQNALVLNVHKLHYVRSKMNDDELFSLLNEGYNIANYNFNEEKLENQYRYDNLIARKVKFFLNFILTESESDEAICSFFKLLVSNENAFAKELYMNEEDLIALSNYDALGSHGAAHLPLGTKSWDLAKSDVKKSISFLEDLTGKSVNSFSYPYGGTQAVNKSLATAFDDTHVKFALTMWRGVNGIKNFQDPFFLLRFDTNDIPGGRNNHNKCPF